MQIKRKRLIVFAEEAVFLDSLKEQTKNRKEAGSVDLVLSNEPGTGNMHFVQMICDGSFEVSLAMMA